MAVGRLGREAQVLGQVVSGSRPAPPAVPTAIAQDLPRRHRTVSFVGVGVVFAGTPLCKKKLTVCSHTVRCGLPPESVPVPWKRATTRLQ